MRIETLVKETPDLEGFRVGRVEGGTDEIVVRIVADGRYAPRCGECGEKAKYRDSRPSLFQRPSSSFRYDSGAVPHHCAATPVIPDPQKPSRTTSPGFV